MQEQAPQWSLGTITGTLGTILLIALATLGVYFDGVLLIYVGIIQPGVVSVFAIGYVVLVVLVPLWLGRTLRAKGTTWRRIIPATAAGVVAISVLFFPVAAVALAM